MSSSSERVKREMEAIGRQWHQLPEWTGLPRAEDPAASGRPKRSGIDEELRRRARIAREQHGRNQRIYDPFLSIDLRR